MSTIPFTAFLERYHTGTRLGESRVATVHRARDLRLQRNVLLHVMHTAHAPEAQYWQQLHQISRTFLSVYDSGMVNNLPAVITEDVTGQALKDATFSSPDQALELVQAVASAVARAAAQGIPHPMISSRNLWLMEHRRVVLLEDWTTSSSARDQIDAAYQAPEMHHGGSSSPTSTVYALGVLLRDVFASTRGQISHRIGQTPRQLAQIIERATANAPQQRYHSIEDFAQALDEFAAHLHAQTLHMPPSQGATAPMQQPPPWQRVPSAKVSPPPQTKVMGSPPPLVPDNAQATATQQVTGGWGLPTWRPSGWQRAILGRTLRFGSRLAVAVVLGAVLLYAYNAASNRVRAFDPGAWARDQIPQAPAINIDEWIDQNTPELPNVGEWIDRNSPEVPNIGEWVQERASRLGDDIAEQANRLPIGTTTYRVTQPINLRSEPSTADSGTIIGSLPAGTRLQQQGLSRPDANGQTHRWIRVLVLDGNDGREGWVALLDDYLEQE